MKTVKTYGMHRSGNNWFMWLLAANFQIDLLGNDKGGWTHGQMNVVEIYGKEPDAVFLLVRHPLSWLPSIWRYRGKPDMEFDEYIRRSDEIDKWNTTMHNWLFQLANFKTSCVQVVRYENLVANTFTTLEEIGDRAGLERKHDRFKVAYGVMDKHMRQTTERFDATHYTEKKYMIGYSPELLAHIKSRVDGDTLFRLGYREEWK